MKKILLGLSILVFAGCGNEKSNSIDSLTPEKFEWDFSKKKKYIYSFSQTVNAENKMRKSNPSNKTYMNGVGYLNVNVTDDNLADLSLTEMVMKIVSHDSKGAARDTMTQKLPSNVIQGMKPGGGFENPETDALFNMLFPIPNEELKIGDSNEVSMQTPFNVNGSRLFSKGQNTLTFDDYKEIEGRNCAVLKGVINISELNVPEELTGEYKCATKGNATYYFDLKGKHYVGSDIEIVMDILMDSATENDEGFGTYMQTKSKNVFKIRLEKIED